MAVVQSCYIPWKGYFDLIGAVDDFVLYDDAQYTPRDWRNRNRIKTSGGLRWLTIPVLGAGRSRQRIRDVLVHGQAWRARHWRSIEHAYRRMPHFDRYQDLLRELYLGRSEERLSLVNRAFLEAICGELGLETRLHWSWDFDLAGDRTGRLVAICRQLGASRYLSGPAAQGYLDLRRFAEAGIEVEWMSYHGYPTYPQASPPFCHEVSVLDLLFATGPAAVQSLLSPRRSGVLT